MNRCAICDITDEDNPKANIKWFEPLDNSFGEFRCLSCHSEIETILEDLSIGDEDFEFQTKE